MTRLSKCSLACTKLKDVFTMQIQGSNGEGTGSVQGVCGVSGSEWVRNTGSDDDGVLCHDFLSGQHVLFSHAWATIAPCG